MGLGLGLSKSKSKSTSDTTGTQTSTPNNPQWVTDSAQNLTGLIGGLAGQNPQDFVAPTQALNEQQFGTAGQLGKQGLGYIGQAADLAGKVGDSSPQTVTGQTAYGGIGNYLNPFSQYVAGNTLNELGRARDMAEQGNGRDAILAGQYGGSRQGVVDANLNRDFFGQVGNTLGGLFSNGYDTALGASNNDANRAQGAQVANQQADLAAGALKLQAASQLGGLGQYGVNSLDSAAGTQQGLAQQQAGAPIDILAQLSQIYGNLPLGLFQGNTTTGQSSTKGTGSQLGMSASASYGK